MLRSKRKETLVKKKSRRSSTRKNKERSVSQANSAEF